jgi:hypothetical protein
MKPFVIFLFPQKKKKKTPNQTITKTTTIEKARLVCNIPK